MLGQQIRLHLIVLIFGFTGILGKLIDLPAYLIVLYRMTMAAMALGIVLVLYKRKSRLDLKKKVRWFFTGFIVCIHWFTFFESIKQSNVSIALVCFSSTALFTAVLEPIFLHKKYRLYELIFSVIIIGGMILVLSFEFNYLTGILYGITSAFLASMFTVLNSKFVVDDSAVIISFYELLGGAFLALVSILIYSSESLETIPSGMDMVYLLLLAIVATAVAFVVSIGVMRKLTPFTVSLTINLEPLYGIVLAILIFGQEEYMSVGFYAGFSLILITILLNAYLKKRERRFPRFEHQENPSPEL